MIAKLDDGHGMVLDETIYPLPIRSFLFFGNVKLHFCVVSDIDNCTTFVKNK